MFLTDAALGFSLIIALVSYTTYTARSTSIVYTTKGNTRTRYLALEYTYSPEAFVYTYGYASVDVVVPIEGYGVLDIKWGVRYIGVEGKRGSIRK